MVSFVVKKSRINLESSSFQDPISSADTYTADAQRIGDHENASEYCIPWAMKVLMFHGHVKIISVLLIEEHSALYSETFFATWIRE